MKLSMRSFFCSQMEWSRKVFGRDPGTYYPGTEEAKLERGPIGPLKHLAKEVQETLDKPNDLVEYADMMHLLFDACRRAGYSYDELVAACHAKLAKNKRRKWPKPTSDEPVEHVHGVND